MAQPLSDATGQQILAALHQINTTLVATNTGLAMINSTLAAMLADQQQRALVLQDGGHYKPVKL